MHFRSYTLLYKNKTIYFYKQQIESLNDTAHHILKNEIDIVLPKFLENRREVFLQHLYQFF